MKTPSSTQPTTGSTITDVLVTKMREGMRNRMAEMEKRIAELEAERAALKALLQDQPALEAIAQIHLERHRNIDVEAELLKVFEPNQKRRLSEALNDILESGLAVSPKQLKATLETSKHFTDRGKGWYERRSAPAPV